MRLTNLIFASTLSLFAVNAPGFAQQPLTIRGRILGADGRGLAGAAVTALALPDSEIRRDVTANDGTYSIAFARRARRVEISATLPGWVTNRIAIAVDSSGATMLIPDLRLTRPVQRLPAVRATVQRVRVRRADQATSDFGPGVSSRLMAAPSLTDGLSGDPGGDLGLALATLPNVALLGGGSGVAAVSAFGLAGSENAATLNGLSFSGFNLPPDGVRLQAVTTIYDPGKGGFAGMNASLRFPNGPRESERGLHAFWDTPSLQWAPQSMQLAGRSRRLTFGGYARGSADTSGRWLYNGSLQLARREWTPGSLGTAAPATLSAIGLSPELLARIRSALSIAGIPSPSDAATPTQVGTTVTALGRLDFRPTPSERSAIGSRETGYSSNDDQLTLLAGLNAASASSGARPGSLGVSSNKSSSYDAFVAGTLSRYLFGWLLNESSLSLQIRRSVMTPDLVLPIAIVGLPPTTGDATAVSSMTLGGLGIGRAETESRTVEARNESAWYTFDRKHQFKITLDMIAMDGRTTPAQSVGAYTFRSPEDLAAGTPESFARTLGGRALESRAFNASIGLGDIFAPFANQSRPQLQMQYGIRADVNWLSPTPPLNQTLASQLGIRTDRLPTMSAVEPMIGLTMPVGSIRLATGQASRPRGALVAGVREYRGLVSAATLDPYLRHTGLGDESARLFCVGTAAPTPDWPAMLGSTGAVPSGCVNGAGSFVADTAPDISVLAPDFDLSRSWRGSLGLSGFVTPTVSGGVELTYAANRGIPNVIDRNFSPITRFTLDAEADRPVFAPASAFDPRTGVVGPAASRVSPIFGPVLETRSDLTQHFWQALALISKTTGQLSDSHAYATQTLSYAFSTGVQETRGFSGTTAGNPFDVDRATLSLPRHTLTYAMYVSLPRYGQFAAFFRGASGVRYTPVVAGDVNGDGRSNDRAFVFDPATTRDSITRDEMASLLASRHGAARTCLVRQFGTVAARNSCSGPPTGALTITLAPDPYRLHLGNRGKLTLIATNVLTAIDALVHGSGRLHGWGAAGAPDAVLMAVRDFDPVDKRFEYTVNPAFGTTNASRALAIAPFALTVDFRLNVGRDWETRSMDAFFAAVKPTPDAVLSASQIRARLDQGNTLSLFNGVLRMRDALRLDSAQVDSITTIMTDFRRFRDSAYDVLAPVLAAKAGDYRGDDGRREWHETLVAVGRIRDYAWARIQEVLTRKQYDMLPAFWKTGDGIAPATREYYSRRPAIYPPL